MNRKRMICLILSCVLLLLISGCRENNDKQITENGSGFSSGKETTQDGQASVTIENDDPLKELVERAVKNNEIVPIKMTNDDCLTLGKTPMELVHDIFGIGEETYAEGGRWSTYDMFAVAVGDGNPYGDDIVTAVAIYTAYFSDYYLTASQVKESLGSRVSDIEENMMDGGYVMGVNENDINITFMFSENPNAPATSILIVKKWN